MLGWYDAIVDVGDGRRRRADEPSRARRGRARRSSRAARDPVEPVRSTAARAT